MFKKPKKISEVLSLEEITQWMEHDDLNVRCTAMNACKGRDGIPLALLEKGLRDRNSCVQLAAARACEGRNIPLPVLENWMNDDN